MSQSQDDKPNKSQSQDDKPQPYEDYSEANAARLKEMMSKAAPLKVANREYECICDWEGQPGEMHSVECLKHNGVPIND